jgi:hypothetical protein
MNRHRVRVPLNVGEQCSEQAVPAKGNFKIKVKGSGRECPLHITKLTYPSNFAASFA